MAQAASTYLGEQRRRSTRIEQTLPIIIRGTDLLGQPFEERTSTQSLSFHGCRYASKHHLPKNTWITIEVPAGQRQREQLNTRARVTWIQRPRTLRELFQVGVELEMGSNVWGVALPPVDWVSSSIEGMETADVSSATHPGADVTEKVVSAMEVVPQEGPLASYLEDLLASSGRQSSPSSAEQATELNIEESPLLRELRHQFEFQAQKAVEKAREVAEQVVDERATSLRGELHNQLNQEHRATAEAFYEKWRQEFEGRESSAREQISSDLTRRLIAQVAQARQEVHENLNTSWGEAIERTQAALLEWERRVEDLRGEVRTVSEEVAGQAQRRLEEKLSQQLDEIRKELGSRAEHQIALEQGNAVEMLAIRERVRQHLQEEMARAQTQWSDLLESSIDSAAQRLVGRVTDSSQQILQAAEQKVAARVADLQQDSGLSIETARAALDEVKSALGQEIARTKTSLTEIENAATHFSEYSRQLEAASRDSLNELRQRLESDVASRVAELDRRAAELQKRSMECAESRLTEMSKQRVEQTAGEIDARIAPVLEKAAEATRQLSVHEEQAKELLHIHRERLRQASAHLQQEATENMSSMLTGLQSDFELAGRQVSAKWVEELQANTARMAGEASVGLAKACEEQLQRSFSRLDARMEDSVNNAGRGIDEVAAKATEKYRTHLGKIEASQLKITAELFGALSQKQVDAAKNQFEETAEGVARTFEQRIQAAAEDAAEHAVAESNVRSEQERKRLEDAAEQVLHSLQARAQTSFSHFQEQLAMTTDRNLAQSNESLASQLGATLDVFREQGKTQLAEWSAKQEGLGAEELERHEDRLRSAGNSWLDATVNQLDALNQKRMDSLIRGAEDAMRKACIDVFDGLAQAMKEKLLGTFTESRNAPAPPSGEDKSLERRASA
ncbi:MAG TPA: PilZ domain-containing protein [Candidatus Acidoferrales bacterium]|nr:PilZ domain-containing protein [Candidatus Acidoferrales bacterium]